MALLLARVALLAGMAAAGTFYSQDGGCRVDAGKSNKGTRGTHYDYGPTTSLAACKKKCEETDNCLGIEYNSPTLTQCEIWTVPVFADSSVLGFKCASYNASSDETPSNETSPSPSPTMSPSPTPSSVTSPSPSNETSPSPSPTMSPSPTPGTGGAPTDAAWRDGAGFVLL